MGPVDPLGLRQVKQGHARPTTRHSQGWETHQNQRIHSRFQICSEIEGECRVCQLGCWEIHLWISDRPDVYKYGFCTANHGRQIDSICVMKVAIHTLPLEGKPIAQTIANLPSGSSNV